MAYELLEEQQEPNRNVIAEAGRLGGKALASGITGLVGGVGDLANLGAKGLEKVGVISPETSKSFREKTLTSEKIKHGLEEQFPSLKPENKIEKFADEVFETLGSLGTGGPGRTLGTRILRKFGLSLGANLGKEITDQIQSEEGSKEGQWIKAGTLFLGSLINPRLARNEAARRYQEAERLLPQGASVSATGLSRQLDGIERSITRGRPRESLSNAEQFVLDRIGRVRILIQNGRLGINQAVAQKRSLNEDLSNLFPQFGQQGTRTVRNQARRVTRSLNNAIDEYGASNPEYLRNLRAGDEIYGTLAAAEGFNNWVRQTFPNSPWSRAGLLFGGQTVGQVPKMLYKVYNSPELRRLYISAIARAAAEDSKEFAKIMDQLDKKLINEENKDQWEFID